MTDLTLKDVFGNSVIYDATNKEITFSINEIGGQDFNTDNVTEANCDKCASKILWALLNHIKSVQPSTNTDPERGIYVTSQGSRRVTRSNVSQFAYQLVVAGYTPDPMTTTLAADDLVMNMGEESNA